MPRFTPASLRVRAGDADERAQVPVRRGYRLRAQRAGVGGDRAAHRTAGFSTLLCPDGTGTFAPFQALSAAAAVTSGLRLGSYVLASPLRTPGEVAWESASLDVLSGCRFELGLGAGRPGAERDAARLGMPFGVPAERVRRIEQTLQAVRARYARSDDASQYNAVRGVQQPRPTVLIAGSGSRMLHLAAHEADILALSLPPRSTEDDLEAKTNQVRAIAGDRFDRLELNLNVAVVARMSRRGRRMARSRSPRANQQRLDNRARRLRPADGRHAAAPTRSHRRVLRLG